MKAKTFFNVAAAVLTLKAKPTFWWSTTFAFPQPTGASISPAPEHTVSNITSRPSPPRIYRRHQSGKQPITSNHPHSYEDNLSKILECRGPALQPSTLNSHPPAPPQRLTPSTAKRLRRKLRLDGLDWRWREWRRSSANTSAPGYIYAANVGWINLSAAARLLRIRFTIKTIRLPTSRCESQDGLGNLRGYAYGANIGWINFESNGAPAIDMITGAMSGWVWSANCGWISLSNAVAYVQTDTIQQGALAADGLPIAWLLSNFGTTST